MTDLCVNCAHMDQASAKKWDKANKAWLDEQLDSPEDFAPAPEFDHWRPHCMKHKRQPVTDPVAGTHLDGPPYLRCMEVRKTQPVTCRDYKERENADHPVHS